MTAKKYCKLVFIISVCMVSNSSFGQILNFKSSELAVKVGDGAVWSDWKTYQSETPIPIVFDLDNERITIFSRDKQVYNIVDTEEKTTDKNGDENWAFYCLNEEGKTCGVLLLKLFNQQKRYRIFINFDDAAWVYETVRLN